MNVWQKIRSLAGGIGSSKVDGYATEASIDLDVLDAHDHASKLLVGVDISRLERRNKERRASPHHAVGEVHVESGNLRWVPHRLERACGVRLIEFKREELRTIERTAGAIIAVLRDGTNVPFVVSTQGATAQRRGLLKPRTSRQEPPLIS
jgi:hypothetical protein